MAYDKELAQKIRGFLGSTPDTVEKKMFGGVGFMVRGNMACGVIGNDLIVRVGAEQDKWALRQPHVRPFDMTGKPMTGWVVVAPEGIATESDLAAWIREGVQFAESLPPK